MTDKDLDSLADPFKSKAYCLIAELKRLGLPFVPFETRRSFSRSAELYRTGRTLTNGVWHVTGPIVTNARAGQSPHNWGLAMDCVLDPKHEFFKGEDRPTGLWDTKTPICALAWQRYGAAVRSVGLVWGGDWSGFKDLPHAELPRWETLRPVDWQAVAQREVEHGR